MSAQPKPTYTTPEEYLRWERKAEARHEYYDGVVVAMAGASKEHNRIAFDLGRHLGNALERTQCEPFSSDMRVRVPECNRYYYPDIMAVCGEPKFEDNQADTIINPICIIEVLSHTTEAKDRGEKLHCYQTLPSLQEYVLVSQYEPLVEVFRRDGAEWLHEVIEGLDSQLVLASLNVRIRLVDIYARVDFTQSETS